jgi:hypothetical protein
MTAPQPGTVIVPLPPVTSVLACFVVSLVPPAIRAMTGTRQARGALSGGRA